MAMRNIPGYAGAAGGLVSFILDLVGLVINRGAGAADLRGKISLLDNDELLLVWEPELRTIRIKKEEDAWYSFEAQYGRGSPQVTDAFVAWQEKLYAYIEQEKERFLQRRRGSIEGLERLLRSGARTVVVTKGAKPYTQKCFDLTGLSPFVSEIYSPPPENAASGSGTPSSRTGSGTPSSARATWSLSATTLRRTWPGTLSPRATTPRGIRPPSSSSSTPSSTTGP